jgi:hypothetical protein
MVVALFNSAYSIMSGTSKTPPPVGVNVLNPVATSVLRLTLIDPPIA